MKRHPIVPYRNPKDLAEIDVDAAEASIHQALAVFPLTIRPQHIIDDKRLYVGRPVMRERQEVKIEEIGDKL